MTQSNIRGRLIRAVLTLLAISGIDVAQASQGPGAGMGTASHLTQMMMAVLVYGTSAIVIAAGLIGALRRR